MIGEVLNHELHELTRIKKEEEKMGAINRKIGALTKKVYEEYGRTAETASKRKYSDTTFCEDFLKIVRKVYGPEFDFDHAIIERGNDRDTCNVVTFQFERADNITLKGWIPPSSPGSRLMERREMIVRREKEKG